MSKLTVVSLAFVALTFVASSACSTTPLARSPAAAPPIAWHRFGPDAFAEARRADKLVMIDAGIEGCTACRWMHEGTYADPDVARRIVASFVAVSVDADQEPDLGERYEPWGWPATIFLTPDGTQVFALQGSEGPGDFGKLLDEIVAKKAAHTLVPGESAVARDTASGHTTLAAACVDANARLEQMADEHGWGGEERVPLIPPFEHALIRARSRGETRLDARASAVGEGEARLLDPVWGGVFVASFSRTWDNPIPEKRTMVEAAALDSFALELQKTSDARWRERANLVRKYLEEWMRSPEGTFYSTQRDAAPRLPANLDAMAYYGLGDAQRRAYGIPPIDHGVYTDQNAAVIQAYVRLYEATGDPEVLAIARRTADALLARRVRPDGGFVQADVSRELASDARLRRDTIDDRLYLKAQGEMGLALLLLNEATADDRYLTAARRIAGALSSLEDPQNGGFFATTERGTDALMSRTKPLLDNAAAARFLARLATVTREDAYAKTAERTLTAIAGDTDLRRQGPWVTGLFALALEESLLGHVEITVVRGGDDDLARRLHDEVVRIYEPRKIVRVEAPGHYPKPKEGAAAYVCTRSACSNPLHDVAEVRAAVDRMTAVGQEAPCGNAGGS